MQENDNLVIIPSRRIAINKENGVECYGGIFYGWDDIDAIALNLQKDSCKYMTFEGGTILSDDEYKSYSIYMADTSLPTRYESEEFVQRMVKHSNFAKADKIVCVLFRNNAKTPFAVVVEDF
jgi:hypothetical protein